MTQLAAVEGVSSFASPRFWPKDASSLVGSIHIQLVPSPSSHDPSRPHDSSSVERYAHIDRVVARVDKALRSRIPDLIDLAIQVERVDGS